MTLLDIMSYLLAGAFASLAVTAVLAVRRRHRRAAEDLAEVKRIIASRSRPLGDLGDG